MCCRYDNSVKERTLDRNLDNKIENCFDGMITQKLLQQMTELSFVIGSLLNRSVVFIWQFYCKVPKISG